MAFWDGWQLWLKMTFVMACAIVVVVGAGCCKLLWMQQNLRTHIRVLQQRQDEDVALMARPSVRERRRKEDIPFGIRALDSGIEVEGIYISRPTSQNPSAVQLPAMAGLISPPPPGDLSRKGTETPVSGAARVLNTQTRPFGPRAISDPFRDGRASAKDPDSASSTSSHATPYYDLPDAETGRRSVRMPSIQSLRSNTQFAVGSRPAQPEVYRPTGTPDPYFKPRRSYIPKHLESRASFIREGADVLSSAEEGEEAYNGSASFGYRRNDPASERSRLLLEEQHDDLAFAASSKSVSHTPAPPPFTHFSTRPSHQRSQPEFRPPAQQNNGLDRSAPSFQSFVGDDPLRARQPRGPSVQQPGTSSNTIYVPSQRDDVSSSIGMQPATRMPTSGHTGPSFVDRAEAEAAMSDMRKVNDGFSVSRHGMRRNRESLIAETRELRADREQAQARRDRDKLKVREREMERQEKERQEKEMERREKERQEKERKEKVDVGAFDGGEQQQQQQPRERDSRKKLQKKRGSAALMPAGSAPASASSSIDPRQLRKSGRTNSQFKEQM